MGTESPISLDLEDTAKKNDTHKTCPIVIPSTVFFLFCLPPSPSIALIFLFSVSFSKTSKSINQSIKATGRTDVPPCPRFGALLHRGQGILWILGLFLTSSSFHSVQPSCLAQYPLLPLPLASPLLETLELLCLIFSSLLFLF